MSTQEVHIMIEKNEYYNVEFIDMTHDGMGVCKIDGFPIFVANALKGEKAEIKIVKVNSSFGFGRLTEITTKSPFRKEPICDHFLECGGCNLMHMNYQMQLDFKQYRTKETLRKLGKIETTVKDAVGMLNPYYYRNKSVIPFGEENGKMIAGLYKKRSHDIIDMKKCYIIPKLTTDIVKYMKNVFDELNIPAYNETIGTGVVRHLVIRNSYKFDDISVTIVTLTPKLPKKDILIKKLTSRYKNVVSIVHNFNPDNTNVVLGKKSKVIFGEDFIRDEINGIFFKISHRSFYQVNPIQTEALYSKALEYADLSPNDIVIDAYCGIGTIGLSAAKYVKTLLGVDVVKQAIIDANDNAKNNKITNAKFVCGKAEEQILHWKNYNVDLLFVDPPRKGCDKIFLETVASMKIPKLVYISCNVSTLARDLNYLQSKGYQVLEVTPFDMFPQTTHIETVCKLRYRKEDL
jgi:23S rRNA (uracil1939-C5)-methyltransferase